jgi:Flp pilus assembly protein TadG
MSGTFAMRRLIEKLRRWPAASEGAAAVEFVLIFPVIVVLYLGGFEVSQLVTTYRKVCDVTGQLADIASDTDTSFTSGSTFNATEVQAQMGAAAQIMAPMTTTPLTVTITQIAVDKTGAGTITWSQGWQGGTAYGKGNAYTMPANIQTAAQDAFKNAGVTSTTYLLVQTTYKYTASFGAAWIGATIPLASQVYILPRNGAGTCTDC